MNSKSKEIEVMQEEWKSIESYEGLYEISNMGRVKSLKRKVWNGSSCYEIKERFLKFGNNGRGYLFVNLSKNGKTKQMYLHRLVAIGFINNNENKDSVNHKNGVKSDNDVENLEWVTHLENMRHASENGLMKAPKHEAKQKPFMCNETGETYYSLGDYKNKTGNDRESARKVLIGKRRTYKGFTFSYL